jgi:hypothetical protein
LGAARHAPANIASTATTAAPVRAVTALSIVLA